MWFLITALVVISAAAMPLHSREKMPASGVVGSTLKVEGAGTTNWRILVKVANRASADICLRSNDQATSRLSFFDDKGRGVTSGGFEGRPALKCIRLARGETKIISYNAAQFPSLSLGKVRRVCYRHAWATYGSVAFQHFEICGVMR